LVALAHAVVVVEAGYRSGARNAAKHARVLGRKLFAVPSAPWVPSGRGCIAELKAGATPLESAKDVLSYLSEQHLHLLGPQLGLPLGEVDENTAAAAGRSVVPAPTTSSPTEGVFRAIQAGASTLDAICAATGLSLRDVQHAVFDLRVSQRVRQDPMGFLEPGRV
jgi:DNA processing protein